MSREEDERLARSIAHGDEAAESTFDRRFRSKVEAFVRRRGIPVNDCVDVTQRILTDALRQLRQGRFRSESTLSTWMHPIIGGGVANYRRGPRRPEWVPLEDLPLVDQERLVSVEDSDTIVAVRQALSRLSTHDQFLLLLRYRQGHTLEEIGPMVRLHKSAVAEHLKGACERFRVALFTGNSQLRTRLKDQ